MKSIESGFLLFSFSCLSFSDEIESKLNWACWMVWLYVNAIVYVHQLFKLCLDTIRSILGLGLFVCEETLILWDEKWTTENLIDWYFMMSILGDKIYLLETFWKWRQLETVIPRKTRTFFAKSMFLVSWLGFLQTHHKIINFTIDSKRKKKKLVVLL